MSTCDNLLTTGVAGWLRCMMFCELQSRVRDIVRGVVNLLVIECRQLWLSYTGYSEDGQLE